MRLTFYIYEPSVIKHEYEKYIFRSGIYSLKWQNTGLKKNANFWHELSIYTKNAD